VLEYILWNSILSINVFSLSVASPSQIALKVLFLTFSHLWVESDVHKFCSALNIAFPFASTSDFALWLIYIFVDVERCCKMHCVWLPRQRDLETDILSQCVLHSTENCVRPLFGSLVINIMMASPMKVCMYVFCPSAKLRISLPWL
jgi:hypothetical protein